MERGRVAVGTCEGANFEGIRLWTERDVPTVPAVVVLDRRRDRKDTHVVVSEGFVPDDKDSVAHVPVDGSVSTRRNQSHSSWSAGGVGEPLGFTTC